MVLVCLKERDTKIRRKREEVKWGWSEMVRGKRISVIPQALSCDVGKVVISCSHHPSLAAVLLAIPHQTHQ